MRGRTLKQALRYYRETALRTQRRRTIVSRKAIDWMMRHEPSLLQRFHDEAYRLVPNPSGRKRKFRAAA